MSILGDHVATDPSAALHNNFGQLRPQVLRRVLSHLNEAVIATVRMIGNVSLIEPRFTRQLAACLEDARDAAGDVRYHIDHQGEVPERDDEGRVIAHRRIDICVLFSWQVGRRDEYLCIECKYLDANDRRSDVEYVQEGVDRIVTGTYALGHAFAIMVGLERVGPMTRTIANVDDRLRRRYGADQGLRPAPRWRLDTIRESEHPQDGGPHRIVLVHGFWPITAAAAL